MTSPLLQVQSVSKSFYQGETRVDIFNAIEFQLQAGETMALWGPSGSGKTTLLSLIAALDQPSRGQILFMNKNLNTLTEEQKTELRKNDISIIFQQFHLLPFLTAFENVLLPLQIKNTKDAEEKAKKALVDVGLEHRMNHRPNQLSGGECQRVAIARAFVTEPKLLLADEPSGSLDQLNGELVMDLLFKLTEKNKMTMLLVTHNKDLALKCQTIYELKK